VKNWQNIYVKSQGFFTSAPLIGSTSKVVLFKRRLFKLCKNAVKNKIDRFTIKSSAVALIWSDLSRLKRNGITDIDKNIVATIM
jgi:hypothetical protein